MLALLFALGSLLFGLHVNQKPEVDVLRPEFDDARKIHVNITVPGLEDNPETIEIKLPVNANEGQLEWTRHR